MMAGVKIEQLTNADAFVVVDLPDAEFHSGIVRCAKKILRDGAVNLARTTTYSYAVFGRRAAGLSGGINAIGEGRDAAVAAAVSELASADTAARRRYEPAKGVTAEEFAPLGATEDDDTASLAARSAVAAAAAALAATGRDSLVDSTVAIEEQPLAGALVAALDEAGATGDVVTDLAEGVDVLFVGSRPGRVAHDTFEHPPALVVASGPLPVTARALATLERAGSIVVPDMLSLGAPLLTRSPIDPLDADAALDAVRERTTAAVGHERGAYLGACEMAETEILTWASELPSFRPIA